MPCFSASLVCPGLGIMQTRGGINLPNLKPGMAPRGADRVGGGVEEGGEGRG